MIKTTLFIIGLVCSLGLFAQDNANISIMLGQTTLGPGLPYTARERCNRQLLSALETGSGLNGNFSVFIVKPTLDLLEKGKIEGIKTQETVKLNLQLQLTNAQSGEVLAVQDVKISGAGNNTDDASNRALQTLKRDNPALKKTLGEFRAKISEYYAAQCSNVMSTAKDLAARKQYREAFTTLHAVPRGVPCFDEVAAQKLEYFTALQQIECSTHLQQANAAAAGNNFALALSILSRIDAASPCFNEAKTNITAFEAKVDEDLKTRYEWLFSFYKEGKAAETARWNAMTALGLSCLRERYKHDIIER